MLTLANFLIGALAVAVGALFHAVAALHRDLAGLEETFRRQRAHCRDGQRQLWDDLGDLANLIAAAQAARSDCRRHQPRIFAPDPTPTDRPAPEDPRP